MDSPTHPALHQILRLDKLLPDFYDRLSDALRGQEFEGSIPNLKDSDLVWLVNYLDKVPAIYPCHLSTHASGRFLMILILPVLLPGIVYKTSDIYVALK